MRFKRTLESSREDLDGFIVRITKLKDKPKAPDWTEIPVESLEGQPAPVTVWMKGEGDGGTEEASEDE